MARPQVLAVCVAAGALLGVARGAAAGGKTSKVSIETDPPGAKVYFNVKEDGEVCTTPCTIDAPIGETPIIIEAENRRSIIENLIVPRRTVKPMRMSYKLKPAYGTLVIDGGDGAAITIDDQDQGTAPRRFEDILAGAHHVVVQHGDKKLYDAFVEVETGHEASVSVPALAPAPASARPVRDAPAIAATAAPSNAAPRAPALAVSAATDIGFRQFSFHYPSTTANRSQQNDQEAGEVLTGAIVELWPTTLLRLGVVPGLALHARFQIGVNPQHVTIKDSMGKVTETSLTTSWRSLEISVHHRWPVASTGTVEVGAGYTDDHYQFTPGDRVGEEQRSHVPDTSYKAVRIGGRASLVAGVLEPYVALENRIVLSGGPLGDRYKFGASAVGYHGALGAVLHLGRFDLRAQGSMTLYSWTFRPDMNAADEATSATDLIEQVGLSVGYTY
jgi:hypothetical protein